MTTENIYSEKFYEREGFEVEIKLLIDDDPDTSHLGKYTDREQDYTIDRRMGYLLGPMVCATHYLENVDDDPEYDLSDFSPKNVYEAEVNHENYDEETRTFEIGYNYRPILAFVNQNYDRNACRYFVPSGDAYLHKDRFTPWHENISDEDYTPEEKARFDEHSVLMREIPGFEDTKNPDFWREILYFAEDYARMEEYNNQEFSYLGYEVVVSRDGTDYAEETLWGFQSDYEEEIWGDINATINYWFEKGEIAELLAEEAIDRKFTEGQSNLEQMYY